MRVVHQKTNQQHRQRRLLPRRPSLQARRAHHTQMRQATSLKSSNATRRSRRSQIRAYPWESSALVFSLGGPILAFSGLGNSSDFEGAATVCCGGLIIGFVLLLVASSQSHAYQKEVKQAFGAVKAAVNVSEPPKTYTLFVIAGVLIGGGFTLAQIGASETIDIVVGIGVILFISGLLMFATWLQTNASTDNSKKKKRILEAAKSQLQYREEE